MRTLAYRFQLKRTAAINASGYNPYSCPWVVYKGVDEVESSIRRLHVLIDDEIRWPPHKKVIIR